jgi:phospholipid/cholesterol/gamma-HCH transport system ATP-binding protein
VVNVQKETGATFFIITHNIPSVMRTAEYMGILFRSGLVRFDSKENMKTVDNPIIRQFLAGRAKGPIGMDEMSDDDETGIEAVLEAQEQERVEAGEVDNEIMTV